MSDSLVRKIGKSIAGRYCITGSIGEGGMGAVFAAIPFDDPSHNVAIKIIQHSRKLHSEDLQRFQKEAALMSQLHHPGIVTFHELGILGNEEENEFGNGYYIVMEIVNGANLKEIITEKKKDDLDFFFQVGLQVSSALDYTHGKDIIHRDIKPQNIVVGKPDEKKEEYDVKLLDFGVAKFGEAMHFTGKTKGADDIAGTPLYMAPELSPHLKAVIDHRIDLYSLGCMLYEVLTGKTPYEGGSRDDLAKKHANETAEPISKLRPDIPEVVANIVHKLLEKKPDDRYQTAHSIYMDLLRAQRQLDVGSDSNISKFELALNDRYQAVSAKLDIVGRQESMEALIKFYDDVATQSARSRISVVKGVSGVGKSRLISEMRNYFKSKQIRFVSGSFSQHESSLPFNALANAFNEYLLSVLKGQPLEATELKQKFKSTLGSVAHMVGSVVPGLEPYISDIPQPEEEFDVDGDDFSTFTKAFSDFARCLVTDDQAVVFILDDLHWADEKSLKLIDHFFSNNNSQRFYLIISYQPNNSERNPAFMKFLEKFSKLRRRYQVVEIDSLSGDSVSEIAGNILESPASIKKDLSIYLMEQARGNPRYLVELMRTLVEMDFLSPISNSHAWEFDYKEIVRRPIRLSTIDLVLSRIGKYTGYERDILEVAAISGMNFYFESLLLGGEIESLSAMKVLQKALTEGIIVGAVGDPKLRDLGKHYQFAHRKARDEIYENISIEKRAELHRKFGIKYESLIRHPDVKTVYSLAHHFSKGALNNEDIAISKKCLRYTLDAAGATDKAGSFQSSEKYYEAALAQIQKWGAALADDLRVAFICEKLADLAVKQRKHGAAIRGYKNLLRMNLRPDVKLPVVHKIVHFQLVGGVISDSLRLINKNLSSIGAPIPKITSSSWFKLFKSVFFDVIGSFIKNNPTRSILRRAVKAHKKNSFQPDARSIAVQLYHSGQSAYLVQYPLLAANCHILAYEECRLGNSSPERSVQTIVDRGVLLAILGLRRSAKVTLSLALKIAEKIKSERLIGYAKFSKAFYIDYPMGRHKDFEASILAAKQYLLSEEDRLLMGQIHFYSAFDSLLKCDLKNLFTHSEKAIRTVSTRNQLSPKAVSLVLFAHLLCNERDSIVTKSEMYLDRRRRVAGRMDDIFVDVINTFRHFAKGDFKKTREYFLNVVGLYCKGIKSEFLVPFEEDFIGLFLFSFPSLFEKEHGRFLMRTIEMKELYQKLDGRIGKIQGSVIREIPILLRAKIFESKSAENSIKLYNSSINTAKKSKNSFVELLGKFWLGVFEADQGKHTENRSKLLAALDVSRKYELSALTAHIEQSLEKRCIDFEKSDPSKISVQIRSKFTFFPTTLAKEHLEFISDASSSNTGFVEDIKESIGQLINHYGGVAAHCVISDVAGDHVHLAYSSGTIDSASEVEKYILPYQDINSTLFLPSSDLPWNKGIVESNEKDMTQTIEMVEVESVATSFTKTLASEIHTEETQGKNIYNLSSVEDKFAISDRDNSEKPGSEANEDLDQTLPIASSDMDETVSDMGEMTEQADMNETGPIESSGKAVKSYMSMTALIPLKINGGNIGLLILEDVGQLFQRNTAQSRQELDMFGAQLGLLIERKPPENWVVDFAAGRKLERHNYRSGSINLESPDWLKIWRNGRLRQDRESTWYLGLEYSENIYLLNFCLINGLRVVREKLSKLVWHHFMVLNGLAKSHKGDITIEEIRDDISALIRDYSDSKKLESISIVSTVFNKQAEKVITGHFGPARPVVVGAENRVLPLNEVVLHFDNNADLRCWEIAGNLSGRDPYIVSFDTSKLGGLYSDEFRERVVRGLTQATVPGEMHDVLESNLDSGVLPRCYVGAVLRREENEAPIVYDKAE